MSVFPTNKQALDALPAWALNRSPQSPPETPIADDLLVGLATNTLTPAERQHVIALLASDPDARELAEGLLIEAEATGIAAVPDRPRVVSFVRALARRPAVGIAAGLMLTTTIAFTMYQISIPSGAGGGSLRRDIVYPVPSPFDAMQKLTDLGFEPGSRAHSDGKAALAQDNLPSASELRATLDRSPGDRLALLRYGYRLLLNNKADADVPFRKVLEQDPDDPDGLIALGQVLYTRVDGIDEAIRAFERALAHAPKSHTLHLNLAMCLDRAGREEEAGREYKLALDGGLEPRVRDQVFERWQSLVRNRVPARSEK
jgi:tetratricopeptide (TPR) repeat protein